MIRRLIAHIRKLIELRRIERLTGARFYRSARKIIRWDRGGKVLVAEPPKPDGKPMGDVG